MAYKGKLSKDLPGGRVAVPEGSEKKSYYKYYLENCEDISAELKAKIAGNIFKKGEGMEIEDRTRLLDEKAFPSEPGYYALKGGGAMTCANIKTPHLTGEMLDWYIGWHALDPLRYAIWNPVDHYNVEVIKGKEQLTDLSVPVRERSWGVKLMTLESMVGDAPAEQTLEFLNPYDCGYSNIGTDRWLAGIAGQAVTNKIPVFATEVLCVGEDGVNEMRCRFWIGYERQADGSMKCKIPKFISIPKDIVSHLVMHNYREFQHLDKVLPALYAQEKDNWLAD